jgi:hypothetical protein
MVIDFWEPLHAKHVSIAPLIEFDAIVWHTFARTLSNDGGLTIEKQMRKTSV